MRTRVVRMRAVVVKVAAAVACVICMILNGGQRSVGARECCRAGHPGKAGGVGGFIHYCRHIMELDKKTRTLFHRNPFVISLPI